ncbi:hypothetical protein [Rheinheimera sp.]|uniref:hypothetical protein n=1 Tax=Rheinheimera sp. TaxID=1869214 RepID=UPI00307E7A4D
MKYMTFWLNMVWAVSLLLCLGTANADEQTSLYPFNPENISKYSLSPDQHLWFLSGKRISEVEHVNGEWQNRRQLNLDSQYSPYSSVHDLAVTSNHLWIADEQKITAYELSSIAPYWQRKIEFPLKTTTSNGFDLEVG